MTKQEYACPFCDYSAGTEGSVKGHISRSTDEAHKGKSGPSCDIQRVAVEESDTGEESTQEANTGDTEQTKEQPTTDGSGVIPESDRYENNSSSSTSVEETACPSCGSTELLEPETVLEDPRCSDEHKRLLRDNDHVCNNCGGVW